MAGPHLLIASLIILLLIAFIIAVLVLNANTKKIIETNMKLVENHNMLLEQNIQQDIELKRRESQLEKLAEQIKQGMADEVMLLKEQTREQREHLELTGDMTDEQLMTWIDQKMDETLLFTDTNLTLKSMALALGLTQKRIANLFKNHPKYSSLGEYLNEKRLVLACRLLREKPNWTIEAVGAEAGFGGRRTFQAEIKRRLGVTPLQYRQGMNTIKLTHDASSTHK